MNGDLEEVRVGVGDMGERAAQRPWGRSTAVVDQSVGQPGWSPRSQDLEEGVTEGTGGQITQGLVNMARMPREGFGQGDGMIPLGLHRVLWQL